MSRRNKDVEDAVAWGVLRVVCLILGILLLLFMFVTCNITVRPGP